MIKYFIAALTLCAINSFAASQISLHETNMEKIQAAIDDPVNTYTKMVAVIVKNVRTNNYKTFNDMYEMIKKETKILGVGNSWYTDARTEEIATNIVKILCQTKIEFRKDAFALTKVKPGAYDLGMYLNWPEHGLNDAELYKTYLFYLTKYHDTLEPAVVAKAVVRLIDIGALNTTITTQKTDLQRLNRLYSVKVLKDKATWEPICSQIRTVIDTY